MATDLSLIRLRELLQTVCGCCDEVSTAVHSIVGTFLRPKPFYEWWQEHSDHYGTALAYAYKAEAAMANAATLCEQNGLGGDAVQLLETRTKLLAILTEICGFQYSAQGQLATPGAADLQEDLWCRFWCTISGASNDAHALLKSLESSEVDRWLAQQRKGPPQTANGGTDKPQWDADTGRLIFRGQVTRTYGGQATNARAVLVAFQEQNWPVRIDDPLPGGKNQQRLNDTIKILNKNLIAIRFRADGSGAGYRWEPETSR